MYILNSQLGLICLQGAVHAGSGGKHRLADGGGSREWGEFVHASPQPVPALADLRVCGYLRPGQGDRSAGESRALLQVQQQTRQLRQDILQRLPCQTIRL